VIPGARPQPADERQRGPRAIALPSPASPINIVATDASATGHPLTGDGTQDIPLQTRVYVTGINPSPCPKCNCGTPP